MPIGLSMISAVLKQKYEVKLFDTTFYPKGMSIDRKQREKHLEYKELEEELPELNKTDMKTDFNNLYNNYQPDLIMVSAVSLGYKLTIDLLKYIDVPIIIGGVHSIVAPEDMIGNPKITHIIRGEPEDILLELVDKILNNKSLENFKGIWYKKNGEIIKNEGILFVDDLNKLPMPDWSIFDDRHFYKPFKGKIYRMGHYAVNRGCPFSCSYCVHSILQKHTKNEYREMNIEKAINELKILTKKYKIEMLKIWDDTFSGYKKDVSRFLKRYIQEINLPFMIQTRPETITEEYAKLLKEANCVNLNLGIESGNEKIRSEILKRPTKDENIIKGFQLCKKYDLRTTANVILGLPKETKKELFETIELTKKCQPSVTHVFLLHPYKGTPIREWAIKNNWIDEDEDEKTDYHSGYNLKNPNFSEQELLTYRKLFPIYINTEPKYYPIIDKAKDDELFYDFLRHIYSKIIH